MNRLAAERETVGSLLYWAEFWGSLDEWRDCFKCEQWCSAHCWNLDQAWQAVDRAIDHEERLTAWAQGYTPGCYVKTTGNNR